MMGKNQKDVLTNQDVEIKQVVEYVFPNSRHRLCMWQIVRKNTKQRYNYNKSIWLFIYQLKMITYIINSILDCIIIYD